VTPSTEELCASVQETARVLGAMWPDDHRVSSYLKSHADQLATLRERFEAMERTR
jgi:hypothetical protein